MKRLNKGKECFFALLFLLLTAVMVNFVSDVLRPAQTMYGATWSAFRAEPEDSLDVIYLPTAISTPRWCTMPPA